MLKLTISEFFKRLTPLHLWKPSYQKTYTVLRAFLLLSFLAVLISDLAECHPFEQYWQVVPDPGEQCRQGFAQLITMATLNVITDVMLVIFPIPIILRAPFGVKRKLQLASLFCLSVFPILTSVIRVPNIIDRQGSQHYRSLWASVEILAATAVANALVLGSFVRDRGVKKLKFKRDRYVSDASSTGTGGDGDGNGDAGPMRVRRGSSMVSEPIERVSTRRGTIQHHWGSDEDLVKDLGWAVQDPELRRGTAYHAWEIEGYGSDGTGTGTPGSSRPGTGHRPQSGSKLARHWGYNADEHSRSRKGMAPPEGHELGHELQHEDTSSSSDEDSGEDVKYRDVKYSDHPHPTLSPSRPTKSSSHGAQQQQQQQPHVDPRARLNPLRQVRSTASSSATSNNRNTSLSPTSTRKVSFFDVGGLLDDSPPPTSHGWSQSSPFGVRTSISAGGAAAGGAAGGVVGGVPGGTSTPPQQRKGSSSAKALLQDLGGLFARDYSLTPSDRKSRSGSATPVFAPVGSADPSESPADGGMEMQPLSPMSTRTDVAAHTASGQRKVSTGAGMGGMALNDVGGLLK
jgi:hypothetical protein